MGNMDEIRLNYQRTLKQAEYLESLAHEISLLSEETESVLQDFSVLWKGESGKAYEQKGWRLNSRVSERGKELRKLAQHLRAAAYSTYMAELKSAEIAKKRFYKH